MNSTSSGPSRQTIRGQWFGIESFIGVVVGIGVFALPVGLLDLEVGWIWGILLIVGVITLIPAGRTRRLGLGLVLPCLVLPPLLYLFQIFGAFVGLGMEKLVGFITG